MPIIGGGGQIHFLPMPMENTGCHSGNIYADILIFANANVALIFCDNSRRRVPLLWANILYTMKYKYEIKSYKILKSSTVLVQCSGQDR